MKTFKQYLTESAKVYNFKIKVADKIPEGFEDKLKNSLERYKVVTFNKISTTPVQKLPLDFPRLNNVEVTIYEAVLEYPATAPQIVANIKEIGLKEENFRVRGAGEPSEVDQLMQEEEATAESLLQDPAYTETENVKHKEYFGADYNKAFLNDLQKVAKERKKTLGQDKAMPDVLGSLGNPKFDKAGINSPIGSK